MHGTLNVERKNIVNGFVIFFMTFVVLQNKIIILKFEFLIYFAK